MSRTQTSAAKFNKFRGSSPFFLIDILCPVLVFQLIIHVFPYVTAVGAMACAGIIPTISCITCLVYKEHPDVLGILIVGAILLSCLAGLLSVDVRLLFPITTGVMGILFLLSLLFARPIIFYIGRQVTTHNNPILIADFNALWNMPGTQAVFRFMTLVWGTVMTLEFVVQIILSYWLPGSSFSVLSPLLKSGIFVVLIIWTVVYIRRTYP